MRKTYLDNVRWITVVIVVLYHVIYMFNGVSTAGVIGPFSDTQPQDVFQYMVYPWFMLLLFVVSGMSARYELEQKTTKEFIRAKTRKLLVPSTIGLLVGGWILGYYNMMISGALDKMSEVPKPVLYLIMSVSGCGVLWYIQVLWVLCMVLVLVRKIEKDRLYRLGAKANVVVLLLFTIVIFGAAQILNTPVIVVYRFGIYGAGFFIGYFVMCHDQVMEKLGKQWIIMGLLAVIAGIAFVLMYWGQPYPEHKVLDTLMCNVFAWLGSLGVLAFMQKWGDFENSFTNWMKRKSWGLYVFHYIPIAMSAWYLRQCAPELAPVLVYILVGIAGFAGAYLLYEVVSRIPVIRWCLLGIKKEK